jgi:hypothetical protein
MKILIPLIALVLLGVAYWFAYRAMMKRKQAFDMQYNAHKETRDVFVLNKKVVRQPVDNKYLRFFKVKTYQIVGRVTVSQSMKGISHSATQTVTFHTDKKEFEKVRVNHKYKMEFAGNYIGKVFAPPPDSKGKKAKNGKSAREAKAKPAKSGSKNKK